MAGDEGRIVTCPDCGLRVWGPRLQVLGCPVCFALTRHTQPRLLTPG